MILFECHLSEIKQLKLALNQDCVLQILNLGGQQIFHSHLGVPKAPLEWILQEMNSQSSLHQVFRLSPEEMFMDQSVPRTLVRMDSRTDGQVVTQMVGRRNKLTCR